MFLHQIRLIQFRSFTSLTVASLSKINCLVGDNGAGKTNFLEGIYLLSSNRGFRTGDRKELTHRSADGFYLQGLFDHENIERVVSDTQKSLTVNEEQITANKLRTYNPIVSFSPNDIFLSTGSSEIRRRFFDAAIALRDDDYESHLTSYERSIRQRNASLKKDPHHADLWNDTLIYHGTSIIEKRISFVKLLIPKVQELYRELAQGSASLKYFNNFKLDTDIENSLKIALTESKTEDLYRKHTSKGPHRDDISIFIDDLPAAKSGSLGQNRTLSFALKIGAVEIIEQTLKRKPILLIDDALLDVDPSKRKRIFNKLNSLDLQLFLTGTTKEFFNFIESTLEVKYIEFKSNSI